MKLRTIEFYIKESMQAIYRNKLMSLASLGITIALLIIVGFFMAFSINLNHNIATIKNENKMEVMLTSGISTERISELESQINSLVYVKDCRLASDEEVIRVLENAYGDMNYIIEGIDIEDLIPRIFIIHLNNTRDGQTVAEWLEGAEGIDEVLYPFERVQKITRIATIVKVITVVVIIILIAITVFIISNTIKLTVFARRKEINIMKYIGATDNFIRWPFIIEGALLGVIGSIISFAIIGYSYTYFIDTLLSGVNTVKFVAFKDINYYILTVFLLIGGSMGVLGSALSIRKYLCV